MNVRVQLSAAVHAVLHTPASAHAITPAAVFQQALEQVADLQPEETAVGQGSVGTYAFPLTAAQYQRLVTLRAQTGQRDDLIATAAIRQFARQPAP